MIVKNPKFEISAVKPSQYPQNDMSQIVLVGKSNVGKSSFINTNSPCLIVASKADKIAVTKVSGVLEDLQQELNPLKDLTFLPFSAERKIYSEDVWNYIENYI